MAGVEDETEEVLVANNTQDTLHLDSLIGHIESIILSDEFAALRENFLNQYCHIFDDEEENKLEYMDVYKKYTDLIEGYIERELSSRESGFKMASFLQELATSHALEGEVFDLLLTSTDFLTFKTAMLEVKQSKEDGSARLEDLLQITSLNS